MILKALQLTAVVSPEGRNMYLEGSSTLEGSKAKKQAKHKIIGDQVFIEMNTNWWHTNY